MLLWALVFGLGFSVLTFLGGMQIGYDSQYKKAHMWRCIAEDWRALYFKALSVIEKRKVTEIPPEV